MTSVVTHEDFNQSTPLADQNLFTGNHALMATAMQQGLHGTPWTQAPGAHIERATAFMLFSEVEHSTLCPISMTYAVTPALHANPAFQAVWWPGQPGLRWPLSAA